MRISEWVRRNRIRCALQQVELAELLSVSPDSVSRWERGAHPPKLEEFARLCLVFKTSANLALGIPPRGKPVDYAALLTRLDDALLGPPLERDRRRPVRRRDRTRAASDFV